MSTILVVEDEARIASFVAKGLRAAGFDTQVLDHGIPAVEAATSRGTDLVVLDIGLPDIDGFEVLRRICAAGSHVPVIILTARSSARDTVLGLETGADDYMAKPFSVEELVARVRLRLRSDASAQVSDGDITLDLRTHQATVQGRTVELSTREFALAEMFVSRPGEVLSREELLAQVWGMDFDPGSNVVDVYVRYLRRKLGADRFETVRGAGYRLIKPV